MDDQQKGEMEGILKSFCEGALRSGNVDFFMSDLLEFASVCVQGTAPDVVSDVLKDLKKRGEVNYALVSRADSHYRVMPPGQTQSTLFGATSDGKKKTRATRFTAKQKKQALEELCSIPSLGPGLTRLCEWLYEQVNEQS